MCAILSKGKRWLCLVNGKMTVGMRKKEGRNEAMLKVEMERDLILKRFGDLGRRAKGNPRGIESGRRPRNVRGLVRVGAGMDGRRVGEQGGG